MIINCNTTQACVTVPDSVSDIKSCVCDSTLKWFKLSYFVVHTLLYNGTVTTGNSLHCCYS